MLNAAEPEFFFSYFLISVVLLRLENCVTRVTHQATKPDVGKSRKKKKPTPIYCKESSNNFRLENSFCQLCFFDKFSQITNDDEFAK